MFPDAYFDVCEYREILMAFLTNLTFNAETENTQKRVNCREVA